jgi:terminase small subunit / prophage DNA-packing protein
MPSKGIGPEVTFSDLTDIMGVTNKTVHTWVKKGCPFIERGRSGKEWKFNTVDVIKWVREQDVEKALGTTPAAMTMADVTIRDKLAAAQLKEYELARIRGQTVVISDVIPIVEECFIGVRSRILAIPGRLAQELANENDAVKVAAIVKREISDALTELSIDPRAIRSQGGSGCR